MEIVIMRHLLRCIAVLCVIFSVPAFADDASVTTASPTATIQTPQSTTQAININTADAATIASAHLTGIGEKRAAAIVAYRTEHGPFKSVDDLKNIKGISQKVIDYNRSHLTVA
jgi:competence protein ComEA